MDLEVESPSLRISPRPSPAPGVPQSIVFCTLSLLREQKLQRRWIDEWRDELCAVYVNEEVFVYSGVCPHFGGGFCFDAESKTLACEWHGWRFQADTGEGLGPQRKYKLKKYRHEIRAGAIEVFLI